MCVLCLLLVVVFQSRLFIFLVGFLGMLLLWVRILFVMSKELSSMSNPRLRLSRIDAKCPSPRLSIPLAPFCAPRNHVLKLGFGGGGGKDHGPDADNKIRFNVFVFGVCAATSASDELRSVWSRRTELAPMCRSKDIVSDMIRGLLELASLNSLVGMQAASSASCQPTAMSCAYVRERMAERFAGYLHLRCGLLAIYI